ncbi:MAG: hypothetical protein LW817_07995 [Candidatus Caenarcaniphilales bacterium]|nr:hypothetical protein [Candidatus Caenarcaniphilales bacterium]
MDFYTKEQLNQFSGVGELSRQAPPDFEPNGDLILDFPGVKEIYKQALRIIESGKTVKFETKAVCKTNSINNNNFLVTFPEAKASAEDGLMINRFGHLSVSQIAGLRVLGNYSLAYIEAKAQIDAYKKSFRQNIDHFYTPYGSISNLILDDVCKAADCGGYDPMVFLLPANALRAYRVNRYTTWQLPVCKESKTKIYLLDKFGKNIDEVKLAESKIQNLDYPIYKVKLEDRWVLLCLAPSSYKDLSEKNSLKINQNMIDSLKSFKVFDTNDFTEEETISCSIGQATRVIFALLGSNYDLVPEALLNAEAGSWSSLVQENASTGRFQGINSMHEVLKQQWFKHADLHLPWNYLGFDKLTKANEHLVDDPHVFLLAPDNSDKPLAERLCFIEAAQDWKKYSFELLQFVLRFVYKQYVTIASRKYLLSTKEIMQSIVFYLQLSDKEKSNVELVPELQANLELIYLAHQAANARADFYSLKTNSFNLARLKAIAQIELKLESLDKSLVQSFLAKLKEILSKDADSGSNLWDQYCLQYKALDR